MTRCTDGVEERFGVVARLEFYSAEELTRIFSRSAGLRNVLADAAGAFGVARCSRGTPRSANRLMRSARESALSAGAGSLSVT